MENFDNQLIVETIEYIFMIPVVFIVFSLFWILFDMVLHALIPRK